jgi:hypothetical protein
MSFRDQIETYANDHWWVPCKDGIVWVYYSPIDTKAQIAKHKNATKNDWVATFLQYADPTYTSLEGLYLIPPSDLAKVKAGQFNAARYPDRKMISSWYDKADKNNLNPEVIAQKPEFNGLNDCAHFVTQCLAAGGIHVETTGVPELFNKLRGLPDTKVLAKTVTAAAAENIVKSGVMDRGDVIIYSEGSEHHHSVVYMASAQISMHTWANHPTHPTLKGDWKASATTDHPLVSLIHFGREDAAIPFDSSVPGWWKVLWRGGTYYYYFEKTGRVGWTQQLPTNLKLPLNAPGGRGYWFLDPTQIRICWTDTGSLEVLTVRPPLSDTHMEGWWNNSQKLIADKMS